LLLVPLPAFAQEQIMLATASDQGTFRVEIEWTPADIGTENTFEMHFIEPETGKEVEDVVYDFVIEQRGAPLFTSAGQASNTQRVTFSEPGSYTILVKNIDGLGEGASFPVQVTPEIPDGRIAFIVVAMTVAILVTRLNRNNLFRLQTR